MYEMLIGLFHGNLNFCERKPTDFPLRKYYQKEYEKLKKQLDSLLNENGQKLLDELLTASSSEGGYSEYDSFISDTV